MLSNFNILVTAYRYKDEVIQGIFDGCNCELAEEARTEATKIVDKALKLYSVITICTR